MSGKGKSILSAILAIAFAGFLLSSVVYYQISKHSEVGEATVIKVAYLPITHSLPLLELAEETEDARDGIKIELVKYGSWPELMDALGSGEVDAASVLVELGIKAYSQGSPLQLAALGHRDGNVIVGSREIQDAKDLEGKKVAIPSPQSSHNILLRQYLEKAGVDITRVEFLELAPTEMPYALKSGEVDAYCVAEPFGAQAVDQKIGHVLTTSDQLWHDSICCGLVWNRDWSTKNQDAAEAFLEAYVKAGDTLDRDKSKQMALGSEYLNSSETVLKQSLEWISYGDLSIDQTSYDALAEEMKDHGLNEEPPTYEEFVYQKGGN